MQLEVFQIYYCNYGSSTTIYNDRLSRVMEDFQLLDDAQEGLRRHLSTKRQVSKLQGLLAQQCRDKGQPVVLFLDIKNEFNTVNHRAIFSLLEANGFNKVDVDFSVKCILENSSSFQLVIYLVNQLRVFFGVVYFKETRPARTSSTSPSTLHIRWQWSEPVGGAALLRACQDRWSIRI